MIRVTVSLVSAVHPSRSRELARMDIFNDGVATVENPNVGHYGCRTYRGRSTPDLDKGIVQRRSSVVGWRRNDLHVWNLVCLALTRMGYTQGHP